METKWTPQAEHNFTTLLTTWNNHHITSPPCSQRGTIIRHCAPMVPLRPSYGTHVPS